MNRLLMSLAFLAAFTLMSTGAQASAYQALGQAVMGTSSNGAVVDPCAFLNTGTNGQAPGSVYKEMTKDECTAAQGSWRKCVEWQLKQSH